jgi:hypothetical protein
MSKAFTCVFIILRDSVWWKILAKKPTFLHKCYVVADAISKYKLINQTSNLILCIILVTVGLVNVKAAIRRLKCKNAAASHQYFKM